MQTPLSVRLTVVLCFTALGCNHSFAAAEDANLNRVFRNHLEQSFRLRPSEASQLGDHRFDHLLDDLSAEARAGWIRHDRGTLQTLTNEVVFSRLSRAGQVDFQVFAHALTRSIWLAENMRRFETDPRVYNEYINDSVFVLLTQSSLPRETNVAHAIARMAFIPRIVAAAKSNLKNPTPVATETAIRQNRGAIAFYERDIFQAAGKTRQVAALKAAAARVVPVLKDYQTFLEKELSPRATTDWRIGPEKFARKLELELDAGLTADQVLADAESEFARVSNDMYVVARQLWWRYCPQEALPPDDPEGRRATVQKVLGVIAREHGRPEDLVSDARGTVARIKAFLSSQAVVPLLTPDRCQVIEMPEFQRGNAVAYMNSPPPLDTEAAGHYAVSPPPKDWSPERVQSLLEEYNRHMLQILTIHEAYPGHYVQNEYANRHPSLIRKVFGSGVFVEGWAVYTEQTMLDQGYGKGDLALRLTQLKFYLRAVANAIIDHKLHCGKMTEEEAVAFMTERAFQSEGEARLKLVRAQQTSCQLSTYFVGRMALYRLRQQLQRELGKGFALDRYHQALLGEGPVPVKFLPELVRARLAQAR